MGYLVSAVFCVYFLLDWRWSFLLQAVVVAVLVAALHELPSEAIDTSEKHHVPASADDEEGVVAITGGRENHIQQAAVRDRCRVSHHRPSVRKGSFLSISTVELSSPDALGGHGSAKRKVRSRSRHEDQGPEDIRAAKVKQKQLSKVSQETRDWSGAESDWTSGSADDQAKSPSSAQVSPGLPVVSSVVLHSGLPESRESGFCSEGGRPHVKKKRLKDRRGRGNELDMPLEGRHAPTPEKRSSVGSLAVAGECSRFKLPTREVRVLMVPEREDESQPDACQGTPGAKGDREAGPRRQAGLHRRGSRRNGKSLSTGEMMKRLAR